MADVIRNPGDTTGITVPEGVYSFDALLVGGGGGGAGGYNDMSPFNGGGGGGAGRITFTAFPCNPGDLITYNASPSDEFHFNIGAGGLGQGADTAGDTGGNSTFLNCTANGGTGGGATGAPGSGGATVTNSPGNAYASTASGYNGSMAVGGQSGSTYGGNGATVSSAAENGSNGSGGGGGYDDTGSYVQGGNGGDGTLEITWGTPTTPYDPTSVFLSDITPTSAKLNWTSPGDVATAFEVQICPYADNWLDNVYGYTVTNLGNGIAHEQVLQPDFVNGGPMEAPLTPNTRYRVRVLGTNDGNYFSDWVELNFRTVHTSTGFFQLSM